MSSEPPSPSQSAIVEAAQAMVVALLNTLAAELPKLIVPQAGAPDVHPGFTRANVEGIAAQARRAAGLPDPPPEEDER